MAEGRCTRGRREGEERHEHAAGCRAGRGDAWQVAGASEGKQRLWMNAAGGKEFDDVKIPKRCLYDDPGSIEGLTFLQDLRHRHRVVPVDFGRELGSNDTNAFIAGKVAMFDVLEGGKYSFLRLLARDETTIHDTLLNPEVSKIWQNAEAAAVVARRIATTTTDYLKANPQ